MIQSKYFTLTGEVRPSQMTVVWSPMGPAMPGVYDISFIQETGKGINLKQERVEISLCRKTLQRVVDEIFRDEPVKTKPPEETVKTVILELTPSEAATFIPICMDYERVCNDFDTVMTMRSIKEKILKGS